MTAPASVKTRLENLIALARLLERVERTPVRLDAAQYQGLVGRIRAALADDGLPEAALKAVLGAHPATAELYENLHYDRSGLSTTLPLERAVATELEAAKLLARFTLGGRRPAPA